ncbi:MAG: ubiquinol-cytochrome C reductase [Candidatus Melainabacteria bacterium RIFCSPHIGHO2_02_FULL_34_12]|nr:MAG: ubiquinol-cytochrome C reductase [Candidatus Melainabacteria bacterium RIFCSPHIGHO2_02_FULL_34_12]
MNYWLVKTEPEEYSFDDLLRDGKVIWDGVRNYQARNNLKLMKKGDQVLVYHSGKTKDIVGIAEVIKEYYPDPTDKTGMWVVVELKPKEKLKNTITLTLIKNIKELNDLPLLKQSRLSVMPVSKKEFDFMLDI